MPLVKYSLYIKFTNGKEQGIECLRYTVDSDWLRVYYNNQPNTPGLLFNKHQIHSIAVEEIPL